MQEKQEMQEIQESCKLSTEELNCALNRPHFAQKNQRKIAFPLVLYSLIRIFAAIKDTLMTKKHLIQLFEDRKVRTVWDEEQQKWYFSIVDVCSVLTDSKDPTAYWRKLKQRLKAEGNETVTIVTL